jgi:hypothetical protein
MNDAARYNLALQAHAQAHHAMRERGLSRTPALVRALDRGPRLAGLGADFRCQGCMPITEEKFPWGVAFGAAAVGAAALFAASYFGLIRIGA